MRHKLLHLCALFAALGFIPLPAPAAAPHAQSAQAETPADHALRALGVRYRLGGDSPRTGFDCSGLVAHAFEQAWGVTLPHNVQAQSRMGIAVKRGALRPGDLVFYNTRNRPYSHVGIYLGEGRFIHAPRPGKRVRVESLRSSYWSARFDGARRLMPPA